MRYSGRAATAGGRSSRSVRMRRRRSSSFASPRRSTRRSASAAEAMEPVLTPLVFAEALDLVHRHRGRGEPVYIVSATLQEIVDTLAEELGFDGAIGTLCEIGSDGAYTGTSIRACHAEGKAA